MKLNPSYTHRLYLDQDMEDFIQSNFDDIIIQCYKKLNTMVVKADFWRYLILYKNGGVYLDMDSTIIKPLDDLISANDEAIISFQSKEHFIQWTLIFRKEHPILKRTIEFVVNNILNDRYSHSVISLTGPDVFSRAIREIYFENHAADATSFIYNRNNYNIPEHIFHLLKRQINKTYYYSSPNKEKKEISKEDKDITQTYNKSFFESAKNANVHSYLNENRNELDRYSYRIYGVDYNGFYRFKVNEIKDNMYTTNVNHTILHWSVDKVKLLKNITIDKKYKNDVRFESYTMDNQRK